MKKITIAFAIIFSFSLSMLSCKKNKNNNIDYQEIITPSIKQNQTLQYKFGLIGIEDGLSISQQAKNFDISSLSRDSTGKEIYTYKPSLNYVGTDEVEITQYISNGSSVIKSIRTMIKLTVIN